MVQVDWKVKNYVGSVFETLYNINIILRYMSYYITVFRQRQKIRDEGGDVDWISNWERSCLVTIDKKSGKFRV